MIGYRNPVVFLRKVTAQLAGIKKVEAWGAYLAVACLCVALSLLLAIHAAFQPEARETAVRGQQHIALPPVLVDVPVASSPREEARQSVVQTAAKPAEDGQWCYDEVHKDWRYQKSDRN